MSSQLTRKGVPAVRGVSLHNWIAFPRELREAIPDLHGGRILEIDTLNGQPSNNWLFGPMVELKLLLKETGKLKGKFVIRVGLEPQAARQLAATLNELADQADSAPLA